MDLPTLKKAVGQRYFAFRLRELRRRLYRSVPLGKDTTKPAQTQHSPFSFLVANAHVAGCGWLGIHEADLQAFGFGTERPCCR
jgi:hypothetical protein